MPIVMNKPISGIPIIIILKSQSSRELCSFGSSLQFLLSCRDQEK